MRIHSWVYHCTSLPGCASRRPRVRRPEVLMFSSFPHHLAAPSQPPPHSRSQEHLGAPAVSLCPQAPASPGTDATPFSCSLGRPTAPRASGLVHCLLQGPIFRRETQGSEGGDDQLAQYDNANEGQQKWLKIMFGCKPMAWTPPRLPPQAHTLALQPGPPRSGPGSQETLPF